MTATLQIDSRVDLAPGRVLPETRAGVGVLFALALANGVFLYGLPGLADTDYAWAIKPRASAAFLGAGFLAGCVPTWLAFARARRWRSFQTLAPALWVLAVSLLAATLLHADRFRWGYPLTWVWTAVYAGVPLAIPVLVLRQARMAEAAPPADASLRVLRVLSAVAGGALVGGAAALFLAPHGVGGRWIWPLTPLLAQAVAPWYAMIGVVLLGCAVRLRDRTEALIPYALVAAWSVLVLAVPFLYGEQVKRASGSFIVWVAGMTALLALGAYGLARASRTEQ